MWGGGIVPINAWYLVLSTYKTGFYTGFSQEPILNSLGARKLISDNYIIIGGIVINCMGINLKH